MSLIKLIAAARWMHNGRRLSRGEVFYTTQADAADLIALRFATRAPDEDDGAPRAAKPKRGKAGTK